MSVSDGNPVNAAYTNSVLASKTSANTLAGVQSLAAAASGSAVTNLQLRLNEIATSCGTDGEASGTEDDYTSNNVVTNGDDRRAAIGKIDAEFDIATGHDHDGVNSKAIDSTDLTGFNPYEAVFQMKSIAGAVGLTHDVSADFAADTPGGAAAAEGVATTAPNNYVHIIETSEGQEIEDANGRRVFGRITEAAGTWTLSFYVLIAGVETATTLAATNIDIIYPEVFGPTTLRPTFGGNVGTFDSLNATADILDASATVSGKINLVAQSFTGVKNFLTGLEVNSIGVVDLSTAQTVANKILSACQIQNPSRLDVKKDTLANLTTYVATATDGQLCYGTDNNKLYVVTGNALIEIGLGAGVSELDDLSDVTLAGEAAYNILQRNAGNTLYENKSALQNIPIGGGTASATNKTLMSKDTVANLTALGREESSLYFSTDTKKFLGDDGTSLIDLTGGGGGAAELDDLTDVTLAAEAAYQVLQRNAGNTLYENTSTLTNLIISGGTASATNALKLPSDTKANLLALAPRVGGKVYFATDEKAYYFDDGVDMYELTKTLVTGGSGTPATEYLATILQMSTGASDVLTHGVGSWGDGTKCVSAAFIGGNIEIDATFNQGTSKVDVATLSHGSSFNNTTHYYEFSPYVHFLSATRMAVVYRYFSGGVFQRISVYDDVASTWTLDHTTNIHTGASETRGRRMDSNGTGAAVVTSLADTDLLYAICSDDDGATFKTPERVKSGVTDATVEQLSPIYSGMIDLDGTNSRYWVVGSDASGSGRVKMWFADDTTATFGDSLTWGTAVTLDSYGSGNAYLYGAKVSPNGGKLAVLMTSSGSLSNVSVTVCADISASPPVFSTMQTMSDGAGGQIDLYNGDTTSVGGNKHHIHNMSKISWEGNASMDCFYTRFKTAPTTGSTQIYKVRYDDVTDLTTFSQVQVSDNGTDFNHEPTVSTTPTGGRSISWKKSTALANNLGEGQIDGRELGTGGTLAAVEDAANKGSMTDFIGRLQNNGGPELGAERELVGLDQTELQIITDS